MSTPYPISLDGSSCSAYNGYIYCVGGEIAGHNFQPFTLLKNVYYAKVLSNGIGTWQNTTPYPIPVDLASCSIYNGYIYCIGGGSENNITGSYSVNSVYYANITASGIGAWQKTISYPLPAFLHSCSIHNSYIYCLGGYNYTNPNRIRSVYYSYLSNKGVSTWQNTTPYPILIESQSCAVVSNYIYCIGGDSSHTDLRNSVYYGSLSNIGVDNWQSGPIYPLQIESQSCSSYNNYIYCVGGYTSSGATNKVYYTATQMGGLNLTNEPS